MMADTMIREAIPGEVDELVELIRESIRAMRDAGIDQWDDVYPDQQTILSDIRSGTAFVAVDVRVIVGMIVLNEHQEPEYAEVNWQCRGRPAVVHRLMVAPHWQGRGLARTLMRHAEGRAAALGFDCIRLDAFCGNTRALRFYEREGYHRAGSVLFRKGAFDCFEKAISHAG